MVKVLLLLLLLLLVVLTGQDLGLRAVTQDRATVAVAEVRIPTITRLFPMALLHLAAISLQITTVPLVTQLKKTLKTTLPDQVLLIQAATLAIIMQ